jgi:precorrin-2 dehydrogenase/sirohydrochlorin ferrochelatase
MVAERKVRGLLAAGGRVRLVSPELTVGLRALAEEHAIEWRPKTYDPVDLEGAFLVFAATNNPDVQQAVCRDARAAGRLTNVADAPPECDFHVPATVRRGDLSISIATEGKSPAVAAMVRRRVEREFGAEYAVLTRLGALLREQLLAEEEASGNVRNLFQKVLIDDIVDWIREQQWERVQQHLLSVLGQQIPCDWERLTKEKP